MQVTPHLWRRSFPSHTFRAVVDADDVLFDTRPAIEKVLRDHGRTPVRSWACFRDRADKELWVVHVKENPGWVYNLPVLPGARHAILAMRARGWEVLCATSPTYAVPFWVNERTAALCDHLGFTEEEVASMKNKTALRASLFIDDKPSTVAAYSKEYPDAATLLWLHNHTVEEAARVCPEVPAIHQWEHVLRIVDRFDQKLLEQYRGKAQTPSRPGGKP